MSTHHTNKNRLAAWARAAVGTACLALFLAVLASNPTLAQPTEPQCGKGQGKGADIATCAEEILVEQQRTIDLLEDMTQKMGAMGLLQADQMDAATRQLGFIRNSHVRGRSEKNLATTEDFDALIVKDDPSVCEFRLLPRFAMGPPPRPICTDEQLAENQCEEVCDFSPSEKARNDQRGLRFEEDLADALEQTKIANDELENGMNSLGALSFQILAAADDPCGFDSPHPNLEPFPAASIMFHNQILIAQELITALGKDVCNQTAACFNTSTACTVLTILEAAQKALTGFVNTINGNFTSAKVDATFDCVNGLKADSDNQGAQLNVLEGKVDAVKDDVAELRALVAEVRSLLSTPQGLREGFPTQQ